MVLLFKTRREAPVASGPVAGQDLEWLPTSSVDLPTHHPNLQVTDSVWVATGYDLANTILIKTSEGHVIVDVAMSPTKARIIKEALYAAVGADKVHTIVYTHSHMVRAGTPART